MTETNNPTEMICPHLGLLDDAKTRKLFADSCHACHQARPPRPLILSQQRQTCLTKEHQACEGFTSAWEGGFPRHLVNKNCQKGKKGSPRILWVMFAVLLVGGVLAALLLGLGSLSPAGIATLEGGFELVERTPTPSPSPEMIIVGPEVDDQPEATPTPEGMPTPGPALMTPFGSEDLTLVVYQVQEGDTLSLIAQRYNTSVDVIRQLNVRELPTLWVGELFVLCVGCQANPGLPTLRPVFLEADTTLAALAADCTNCTDDELRRWNGLGETTGLIPAGRWVVLRNE